MNYMGAKTRLLKFILPIINSKLNVDQYYIEPFGGGMNVISEINGKRIASDSNRYLISLFIGLQDGRVGPSKISREFYSEVRVQYNLGLLHKYDSFTIGWVGYMASANGRFFEGGYAGVSKTKGGSERDYISEKIKNITKQIPKINGVKFVNSSYKDLNIPTRSVVYCDPPYKGTKQYAKDCKEFDYIDYYNWCRDLVANGHTVICSEYEMPRDFVCVWQQEVKSSLSANGKSGKSKKSIERLFVHESQVL